MTFSFSPFRLLGLILLAVFLGACQSSQPSAQSSYTHSLSFEPGQETDIRKALITAENSTEITLKAGTYRFEKLSLQGPLEHIAVRGAGSGQTIIDFSGQADGGEGFRVDNVNHFLIEGIRLQESKGDLIKVKEGKDIRFIDVHTVWEGEPEISNGGYGIYPVLC